MLLFLYPPESLRLPQRQTKIYAVFVAVAYFYILYAHSLLPRYYDLSRSLTEVN